MRIGVFDSGVGGITVLQALRDDLPGADYVYLGDTAHVPYGGRSAAQVERLSGDCASLLKSRGVEAIVVACNTASSLALPAIRKIAGSIPVFGVVEPGVEAALAAVDHEAAPAVPVLVCATRATVRSGAYGALLRERLPKRKVIEQACPLLVPMIEEGWVDHPILHLTLGEYVAQHREQHPRGVALLGCTHYPWIQRAFEHALPGWVVVNSAQAVVAALERRGIVGKEPTSRRRAPVEWLFTDPDAVPDFARRLIEAVPTG